jgi:hypothetical protein
VLPSARCHKICGGDRPPTWASCIRLYASGPSGSHVTGKSHTSKFPPHDTRHTTQQEQATARSTPSHRALAPAAAVASRKAWAGIQLRHVTRHWLAALVVQSDLCLAYSPASSPRPSPPSAALSIVCTFSVHTIALLTWEPLADWKALLQPSLAAPKLHAHSVDARGQALDSLRRSSGVSATT